jgi:hypothetical protein
MKTEWTTGWRGGRWVVGRLKRITRPSTSTRCNMWNIASYNHGDNTRRPVVISRGDCVALVLYRQDFAGIQNAPGARPVCDLNIAGGPENYGLEDSSHFRIHQEQVPLATSSLRIP